MKLKTTQLNIMAKEKNPVKKSDTTSWNGYNRIETWNEDNIKELSSIYYRVLKLIGEDPEREGGCLNL